MNRSLKTTESCPFNHRKEELKAFRASLILKLVTRLLSTVLFICSEDKVLVGRDYDNDAILVKTTGFTTRESV